MCACEQSGQESERVKQVIQTRAGNLKKHHPSQGMHSVCYDEVQKKVHVFMYIEMVGLRSTSS